MVAFFVYISTTNKYIMKKLLYISITFYTTMILMWLIVTVLASAWFSIIVAICILGLTYDIVMYQRWKKGKKVYTYRNLFN